MLMVTENASRVIGAIVERNPELPDSAGLRIASISEDRDESGGLSLSTTGTPQPGDQVVEAQEPRARVFLEPDAAMMLDDKVLDAQIDDSGQVQFLVAPQ